MALRISLILAILAGLGVIGVSWFVLKPQVEGIIAERNDWHKKFDDTDKKLKDTSRKLSETQTKLTSTEKNLEDAKAQLTSMTSKAESEEKRANGLQTTLNQTKATLKTAQDLLERWRQVGLEPDQVKALIANENKLKGQVVAMSGEATLMEKKISQQELELDILRGKATDPYVPPEAQGRVAVVDPKWDFVVLDFGAGKKLPKRGVLLVSRNGELVAKVRVMSVEDQRSIANVMPGWKLKDILEGDAVFPY